MSSPARAMVWESLPVATRPADGLEASTLATDPAWKPLRQPWLAEGASEGFQPGWARVQWTSTHLIYDVVLTGSTFSNTARRLNELTWELGDVCEIFADAADAGHYIEIHITPENHRLQLRFPPDGITAVRAGRRALTEFMVNTPDWVQTETHRSNRQLHVRAILSASILGFTQFTRETVLRTAVCRYDYAGGANRPLLSSTAALSAPAFHQRDEWSWLHLRRTPTRKS